MPGTPGATFARAMLAEHPAVRVLVVSGYADVDLDDVIATGRARVLAQAVHGADAHGRRRGPHLRELEPRALDRAARRRPVDLRRADSRRAWAVMSARQTYAGLAPATSGAHDDALAVRVGGVLGEVEGARRGRHSRDRVGDARRDGVEDPEGERTLSILMFDPSSQTTRSFTARMMSGKSSPCPRASRAQLTPMKLSLASCLPQLATRPGTSVAKSTSPLIAVGKARALPPRESASAPGTPSRSSCATTTGVPPAAATRETVVPVEK